MLGCNVLGIYTMLGCNALGIYTSSTQREGIL